LAVVPSPNDSALERRLLELRTKSYQTPVVVSVLISFLLGENDFELTVTYIQKDFEMTSAKSAILLASLSIAAAFSTQVAYADDACAISEQTTFCRLGAGQTDGGNVVVNSGRLLVTKLTYSQNQLSTQACSAIGKTDLHADLRIDGDALTEVDSGRFIQIVGLAEALGSNQDLTEGPAPALYTIKSLNTDPNSGVEIATTEPLSILAQQASPVALSFILNGQPVRLPAHCR
jgi:hypothetical protein